MFCILVGLYCFHYVFYFYLFVVYHISDLQKVGMKIIYNTTAQIGHVRPKFREMVSHSVVGQVITVL